MTVPSAGAPGRAPDLVHRGKVRDLYDAGDGHLLMVASDRISAFDVVMAEPIPDKGRVLTAMTAFWCESWPTWSRHPGDGRPRRDPPPGPRRHLAGDLDGRAMLVRRAEMLPLECIVRGYLAGQAYEEYARAGTVHGAVLPTGLRLADRLAAPLFTPSTKAEVGHDENIAFAAAVELLGPEVAGSARRISLALYERAAARAEAAGFVLADTKFELGWVDGVLCVCDEVVTPTPPGCGRPTRWSRGPRRRPSTSSRCATGCRPALGSPPAPAAPSRRGGGGHRVPLRGRLRAGHRPLTVRLVRCAAVGSRRASR